MDKRLWFPIVGVVGAIAITATMDANGLTDFSALPLLPLLGIFWFLERLPLRAVGFAWGRPRDYALASLYPALVIGVVSLISLAGPQGDHHWPKAGLVFAEMVLGTIVGALLTEEGFFRGWLWASLRARGLGVGAVLACTSIAFALWHISYVTLAHGFTLPPLQAALFVVNAALMGAIWGALREISGSILVSSVSHAVWNGGAYALFGEGPKAGAGGLANTIIFGPEIGVVGLLANAAFLCVLLGQLHHLAEHRVADVRG